MLSIKKLAVIGEEGEKEVLKGIIYGDNGIIYIVHLY